MSSVGCVIHRRRHEGVGTHTLTGAALKWQQFYALMIKRFHHARRNFKGVISQILLPAIFISIAMTMALSLPPPSDLPPLELSPSMFPRPNYIPFGNEAKGINSLSKRMEQTVTLPSGVGASCCLRSVNDTLGRNTDLRLSKELLAQMFDKSCRNSIDEVSDVYLKRPKNFYFIYSNSTNRSESVTHRDTRRGCRCSAHEMSYVCDKGAAGVKPKEFVTITKDTLQNITERNISEYLLYTTNVYRQHR